MSKRADPNAAFAATTQLFQKALQDRPPREDATQDPELSIRTTLTITEDAHRAIRRMAADARCKTNDIVVIAIEDVLLKKGALVGGPSRLAVRRRLGLTPTEPAGPEPDNCPDTNKLSESTP